MRIILLLIAVIGLNSLAQVFLKFSALNAGGSNILGIANVWLLAAFILTGLSFLAWRRALMLKPLSWLHPFLALGFLTVPFLCAVVFHEALSLRYWLGILLIVFGICATCAGTREKRKV